MSVKRVVEGAMHRNGVDGEPFHVVLFESDWTPDLMLGVVFDAPGAVAVFNLRLLEMGVIAFGGNSHRGDDYEADLRAWIARERRANIDLVTLVVKCDDCRTEYAAPPYYSLGTGYSDGDGVVAGVFGDGEHGLVHASDRSVCTGSLCARCAGPDLEPDVPGDVRRPTRVIAQGLRSTQGTTGPGHAAADVPTRAYAVREDGEAWFSCLKCLEDAGRSSVDWRPVEEDGTFGTRECETCGTLVAGR